MKIAGVFIAAGFAAGVLTGCMATVHDGYGGAGVSVGYYDDYYGPYYGGYWGDDGYFYYYSDATRVKVVRDNDRHFRRDQGQGFHRVEARRVRERMEDRREQRQERREENREERHDNNNNNNNNH